MPKISLEAIGIVWYQTVVANQERLENGQGKDHSFYSDSDKSFHNVKYTLQCAQNEEMGNSCIRGSKFRTLELTEFGKEFSCLITIMCFPSSILI